MDILSLLLLEYTEILVGNQKNYSDDYFNGSRGSNEKLAIQFVRYVAHVYFQCDNLEAARATFSKKLFSDMKLDKIIHYIHVPAFVDTADRTDYIIDKIFTNSFDSEKWIATRYCKRILEGTVNKFPKNYMLEDAGIQRACFCLRYFLTCEFPTASPASLYAFAAGTKFRIWLKDRFLSNTCAKLFSSPVDFLHIALPDNMQDDMLHMIYNAVYRMSTVPSDITTQYRNLVFPDDIATQEDVRNAEITAKSKK